MPEMKKQRYIDIYSKNNQPVDPFDQFHYTLNSKGNSLQLVPQPSKSKVRVLIKY